MSRSTNLSSNIPLELTLEQALKLNIKNNQLEFDNEQSNLVSTWKNNYDSSFSLPQLQLQNTIKFSNFEQMILGRTFYPKQFINSSISFDLSPL